MTTAVGGTSEKVGSCGWSNCPAVVRQLDLLAELLWMWKFGQGVLIGTQKRQLSPKERLIVKRRWVVFYSAVPVEMSSRKDRGIGAWKVVTKAKSKDEGLPFKAEEEG